MVPDLTPRPRSVLYSCMAGRLHARVLALVLPALAAAAPAGAQYGYHRSEAQYGEPVDASIDDLINTPTAYVGRAVRTRGMLEISNVSREVRPSLRGTFGSYILLYPVTEVQFEWEQEAKRWYGKEVEVTGVFGQGADQSTMQVSYNIVFWAYLGPPDNHLPKDVQSHLVRLDDLLTPPRK